MNKEELDKHFEEVDRKQEEKGRSMMCLYSLLAVILGAGCIFALVVSVVYLLYKEPVIDDLPPVVEVSETTNIRYVTFLVGNKEYTSHDLMSLDNIPTVIDVHVFYTDNTDVIKPAYVCYDDIAELQYEDNAYGKVILPQ